MAVLNIILREICGEHKTTHGDVDRHRQMGMGGGLGLEFFFLEFLLGVCHKVFETLTLFQLLWF